MKVYKILHIPTGTYLQRTASGTYYLKSEITWDDPNSFCDVTTYSKELIDERFSLLKHKVNYSGYFNIRNLNIKEFEIVEVEEE